MLELRLLPARQGDAIWIRWGSGRTVRQMIIDMGTTQIGSALRRRLEALEPAHRAFELLVVTHIDADHIGGVLSCLVQQKKELDGLAFRDVWFNGLEHLDASRSRTLEDLGGAQGALLSNWLKGQPWNDAFHGGPVCRAETPPVHSLPGGLKLTVLGPTQQRLAELAPVWRKELELALKRKEEKQRASGLEALGGKKATKPRLATKADLAKLAAKVTGTDPSKANGSSIALLVEHGRRRVLLAGDAYAHDLIAGIDALGGRKPLRLDAFKLPHHGSRENTTEELIRAVDCPAFLFSTDGTQFQHPHTDAVACVIESARARPAGLMFNARSKFTGWWDNNEWASDFDYTAKYGDAEDGLVLRFS